MTDAGGIRPAPLIDESMTSKSSKFYRSGVAKKSPVLMLYLWRLIGTQTLGRLYSCSKATRRISVLLIFSRAIPSYFAVFLTKDEA